MASAVTVTAVAVGLGQADLGGSQLAGANLGAAVAGPAADASAASGAAPAERLTARERIAERAVAASRTSRRVTLQPKVTDKQFATADLNLWTDPGEKGELVGEIDFGSRLGLTGQVVQGFAEIIHEGEVRWVNAEYLSDEKPEPEPSATIGGPFSTAPCASGSSPEAGLTSAAIALHRAVCAVFPQISTYGGYRGDGEHVDGRAIDIMVSGDLGWEIAEWLRANASALQIRDVIYAQRIWTPDRAGEGWRSMEDRGSATANHYDHVHVAVY